MINIFVEGDTDIKLLSDFIKYHFGFELDQDQTFVNAKGQGGLFGNVSLIRLQKGTDNGETNLVIFDADEDYQSRKEEILRKAASYQVTLDLFLYPNDADSGEREDFLAKMANHDLFNPFYECYKPYVNCIIAYKHKYDSLHPENSLKPFISKASKAIIYNYLKMHGGETTDRKIDYTDRNFWNIDAPEVEPLRIFLANHFPARD